MVKRIISSLFFLLLIIPGLSGESMIGAAPTGNREELHPETIPFFINGNENVVLAFADFLFSDHDYFRAISVYKAIYYYSQKEEVKTYCILCIAKAYHKSHKYKSSIRYASKLANIDEISDELKTESFLLLGLNYYSIQNLYLAHQFFTYADELRPYNQGLMFLGLIEAENRNWEKAGEVFDKMAVHNEDVQTKNLAHVLSQEVVKGKEIHRKSPVFSAVLSSLIPGAGQVYSRHFYDALQAFIYVGIFGCASFGVYLYDSENSEHYIYTIAMCSITGLLHLSNIISAYKTATYYNHRNENLFLEKIRDMVLNEYEK